MKYQNLLLFASLILCSHVCEGSLVLWASCMAVTCGVSAITGSYLICKAGLTACRTILWCFDDGTTVVGPDGRSTLMINAHEGDVVKTLDENGMEVWTKVTGVHHIDRNTNAIKIEAVQNHDGHKHTITVSSSHGLVRVKNDGAEVVGAKRIQQGDILRVESGSSSTLSQVVSTTKTKLPSRTVFYTEDNTVLANGIHAATSCGVGDNLGLNFYKNKMVMEANVFSCMSDLFNNTAKLISMMNITGGMIGKPDIFVSVVEICYGEKVDKVLLDTIGSETYIPDVLKGDNAALLNLIGEGEGESLLEATEFNAYLCDTCAEGLDVSEFVEKTTQLRKKTTQLRKV